MFSIFRILRLVSMEMEHSWVIKNQITSFMRIRGGKRGIDLAFCGLVEEILRNDETIK